jgi:hypothetical protein
LKDRIQEKTIIIPELEKILGQGIRQEWNSGDVEILKRYYGKVPVRALAKVLGRTVSAVRNKADQVGTQ